MEITNRKATHDYFIHKKYEAGIELLGTEIKSIRNGSANFNDCYGKIRNNEVYLLNMYIARYEEGSIFNHDERRTRKLLLHKKEIQKIIEEVNLKRYTIIPLRLYFKKGKAKIEIAICEGKKLYDKRESIKRREMERKSKDY